MLNLIVHDRLITVHNVEACIDGNLVDVADIVGPEVGLAHSDILLHLLVLLLVVQLNLGVGGGVTLDVAHVGRIWYFTEYLETTSLPFLSASQEEYFGHQPESVKFHAEERIKLSRWPAVSALRFLLPTF